VLPFRRRGWRTERVSSALHWFWRAHFPIKKYNINNIVFDELDDDPDEDFGTDELDSTEDDICDDQSDISDPCDTPRATFVLHSLPKCKCNCSRKFSSKSSLLSFANQFGGLSRENRRKHVHAMMALLFPLEHHQPVARRVGSSHSKRSYLKFPFSLFGISVWRDFFS
jgi:hypothetical protein